MNRTNQNSPLTLCRVACGCLALALLTGCQSNGGQELLERELRLQEDRIFRLEDELDDMCRQLDSARRENQALKDELRGEGGAGTVRSNNRPVMPERPTSPPEVTLPPLVAEPEPLVPPANTSPAAEPAKSFYRDGAVPDDLGEAPPFEAGLPQLDESPAKDTLPPPESIEPNTDPEPLLPEEGSILPQSRLQLGKVLLQGFNRPGVPLTGNANQIARLAINRQLTGGWNNDGFPGDEGVMVVFEPRDAQNKPVEAIGDVSIVVLDPSRTGQAGRVARWNFTTDEAAMHFHRGPLGRGFQFELPWAAEIPTNRDLRVVIRVTPPNGKHIEADSGIRVTLPLANDPNWKAKPAPIKPAAATSNVVQSTAAVEEPPTPQTKRPNWSPQRQ